MIKIIIIPILLFSILETAYSQDVPQKYYYYISKADSLYKIKNYKESALNYSKAFCINRNKGFIDDRYNAACSWALAGISDSAFINLEKIAFNADYEKYNQICSDSDLIILHNTDRWKILIDKVKDNQIKLEKNYDKSLMNFIDSLKKIDQKWRNLIVRFDNNLIPKDSITREYINNQVQKTDSLNYFMIRNIISKYGYPNFDKIGINGSHNFWLIIQHQDKHPEFQDSVLTLMKVEVDKAKVLAQDYAYLLDRVKVNTGQFQVYGTQMTLNKDKTSFEPKPVIDPDRLNERRKSMGLNTIESYIETMNNRYFGTLKK